MGLNILKKDKKIETALISGISLAILILVYFFIGVPVFNQSSKLKVEFKNRQDTLKESENLIRAFPNPQKEMAEIEQKAQELRNMGASTRQTPRIIQLLALPANKLNINVTSIRPREDIQAPEESLPPGVTKLYIDLSMSCSYQLFAEYCGEISRMPTSFIMERLSLEKKSDLLQPEEVKSAKDKPAIKPEELSITMLLSTYLILEL